MQAEAHTLIFSLRARCEDKHAEHSTYDKHAEHSAETQMRSAHPCTAPNEEPTYVNTMPALSQTMA
eukprot:12926124-Prorocentrum_lima.AAC.1